MPICPISQHNKNGMVERANRTLEEAISCSLFEGEQSQWPKLLPKVLLALNCHKNSTVGNSPHRLVFRQEARLPSDKLLGTILPDSSRVAAPHRAEERKVARIKDESKKAKMRAITDNSRKATSRDVQVGDRVLLRRAKPATKFDKRFHSGFTVEAVHPKKVIVRDSFDSQLVYHKDRVKVEKHRRARDGDLHSRLSFNSSPICAINYSYYSINNSRNGQRQSAEPSIHRPTSRLDSASEVEERS